jgi:hypothetical protein
MPGATMLCRTVLKCSLVLASSTLVAQTTAHFAKPPSSGQLGVVKTVESQETASSFEHPIECDDGNVYLNTDADGISAIRKLSPAGERIATFNAGACPDIKVQLGASFAVGSDSRVYQIVFPQDEPHRYVLLFDRDGSCHSKIKLGVSLRFVPYQIATYPSGTMLIAGLRSVPGKGPDAMVPYIALFSSSGGLLKAIDLESDDEHPKADADSNPSDAVPSNPGGKGAISRGMMQAAQDGNVYFIRHDLPAVIYVVSESGAVVRHFNVDPGKADLLPTEMHIASNRIALLFQNDRTHESMLRVVNLNGEPVAEYAEPLTPGKSSLGWAFVCYTYPPHDTFTFLTTLAGDKLGLRIVEPH